jgi:translation initiation factor 6
MHIITASYHGNPNVGLFGWANNKICLLGKGFKHKYVQEIQNALKVPVYQISLCETDLIGIFCVGNNNGIVVPSLITPNEEKELERICHKAGMTLTVVSTELTALGNNILCNDFSALVNPEFSARVKKIIRQALNVRLNPGTIAEHGITGSLCVIRDNFAVTTRSITDPEEAKLQELFGVTCFKGTLNFGSPNIRSGMIINSNGFVIGDMSTGIEITDIDEALGFLEQTN